ncbi:hypothetical protein C8Q80DRAFT_1273575 [Daedaleopsis nitida]|nr:hypothetical protein C8Q80DRAFT_1273575 [Daedaleopsis nitida]
MGGSLAALNPKGTCYPDLKADLIATFEDTYSAIDVNALAVGEFLAHCHELEWAASWGVEGAW